MCKVSFCEIWHLFFGLSWEFSLVLSQITNYIFSPWKMKKRMRYFLNYSGTRFFVHWKLILSWFLLKTSWQTYFWTWLVCLNFWREIVYSQSSFKANWKVLLCRQGFFPLVRNFLVLSLHYPYYTSIHWLYCITFLVEAARMRRGGGGDF